jgi:hypothetical protein
MARGVADLRAETWRGVLAPLVRPIVERLAKHIGHAVGATDGPVSALPTRSARLTARSGKLPSRGADRVHHRQTRPATSLTVSRHRHRTSSIADGSRPDGFETDDIVSETGGINVVAHEITLWSTTSCRGSDTSWPCPSTSQRDRRRHESGEYSARRRRRALESRERRGRKKIIHRRLA